MEECTFNWIYRNFILITCLGLVVFTKEESQQYSYECNENGDITLLGLLQYSQVTIKEVAYTNGSSVVPNCTFTADQYGHVIINRSCTNDFPEMQHKFIAFEIVDDTTDSSTAVSSSQASISTLLSPALQTQITSISSVTDMAASPSTQVTSILSPTLNVPTASSTIATHNIPASSTTSTTTVSSTSLSTILSTSSSTSSTTFVSVPSSKSQATNVSSSTSTLNKTLFDSPLILSESFISPEIGLKSSFPMENSLTSTKTKRSTAKTSDSVVQTISSQPFRMTPSNTEMKHYPETTLKMRRVFREKRTVDKTEQTFMLTCQQYKNGVIHNILGQLIDRDTISFNPVFNSVGSVEMQFKSYRAETEDALKYLPDISTVYLGDKFFMFLKYMGQQDYKIVPQNCSAYDGGVAVTNNAKPNIPLWSYDSCVSEIARKYHLMHSFEKINDKIIFAELFGFHFVDDADITVACDVMICNKADNTSMCTLKQNDCGKTTSNLRAKRTTKNYVKVVRKLKVMNRRQQYTENTAMKHRNNSLILLIGAVVYGVEHLRLPLLYGFW